MENVIKKKAMSETKLNVEQLNKFNISIGESMKMIEGLEDEKTNMAKGHLLDALRRMSEYFVESNRPAKVDNIVK
jgi:hypothetical protein